MQETDLSAAGAHTNGTEYMATSNRPQDVLLIV